MFLFLRFRAGFGRFSARVVPHFIIGGGIGYILARGDVRRGFGEWIFRIFVQDSGGDGVIMSAVGNNGN